MNITNESLSVNAVDSNNFGCKTGSKPMSRPKRNSNGPEYTMSDKCPDQRKIGSCRDTEVNQEKKAIYFSTLSEMFIKIKKNRNYISEGFAALAMP